MHSSHSSRIPGRWLGTSLALFAVAMGLLAVLMTVREFDRDRRARSTWIPTKCLIQEAAIRTAISARSSEPRDFPTIRYVYQFRGTSYTSDTIDLRSIDGMHSTWDRDYVAFVRAHWKGQPTTCWVNPEKASQAVLAIDLPIEPYAILPGVGCLFVVVGTIVTITTLRRTIGEQKKANAGKANVGKPNAGRKRVLPVYKVDELSIQRTPMGVCCRFPRRHGRASTELAGAVIGAVILFTIGWGSVAIGRFLRQHETPPSLSSTIFVWTVSGFLGLFFPAVACLTLLHSFFAKFGHSEVVLRGGRIYGGERAGWLWLGRSLALGEPMDLVIYRNRARPQFPSVPRPIGLHSAMAKRYHDEGLAVLDVRTASARRLTLAQGYPAETLLSWAHQMRSSIDQAHGPQPIVSAIGLYVPPTDRPDPRTLRPAVTRIVQEETAELLRVVLPTESFSIRHVPWIAIFAVASLIWHGGIGWSNSMIEAVIVTVVVLAPGIAYLPYRFNPRQMIVEVRKSNGELAVTCISRAGEHRRTWSAQQRPCVMRSRAIWSNNRRVGTLARPMFLKVSAIGTPDYSLGGAGLTSQERIWCAALITNALRSSRESNAASARIARS
jgi:hypothetical protein